MQKLESDALQTLKVIRDINTLPLSEASVLLQEKAGLYSLAYNQKYKKTLKQFAKLGKLFRKP